jgi:hypothetical protein
MNPPHDERARSAALLALLIGDVIAARQRLLGSHAQTARRDVVRASLAAMEGMTWLAREHVRTALAQLQRLTPVADLALQELSYGVSESGKLIEQSRGLPLLTAIRLLISQARIISPEISVDYSTSGWSNLRHAVDIRNRITHPKAAHDLAVSDADLNIVASGLSWLAATIEYVMASTNLALVEYNEDARDLLERLIAGDAEALAEYEAALLQPEAEG